MPVPTTITTATAAKSNGSGEPPFSSEAPEALRPALPGAAALAAARSASYFRLAARASAVFELLDSPSASVSASSAPVSSAPVSSASAVSEVLALGFAPFSSGFDPSDVVLSAVPDPGASPGFVDPPVPAEDWGEPLGLEPPPPVELPPPGAAVGGGTVAGGVVVGGFEGTDGGRL